MQCKAKAGRKPSPVHNGGVDAGVAGIIKLIDGNHVEVAQDAGRDGVAPAPWESHRGNQLCVCRQASPCTRFAR